MTGTTAEPRPGSRPGPPADAPAPWPLVALAGGVLLLFDTLRVFLPSLITLYGRAGETPPERMGLFAALWFALPFAAVPLSRVVPPRLLRVAGAALLAAARIALQATDGGTPQLLVSAAGVTAGLVFLYGSARTTAAAWVPAGLTGGLAASVAVHFALGQMDLVWRDGPLPWLAVLALCAAFLWSVRLSQAPADPAPAAVWFLFGPMLLLTGMYFGQAGLLSVEDHQIAAPLAALGVAVRVAAMVGAALCAWTVVWGPMAGIFLVLGIAIEQAGSFPVLPVLVATVALGACAGLAGLPHGEADGPRRTSRAGGAVLAGMLVFLVAVFLYYAAYDADLGFPNGLVPVAVAVLVAGVAWAGGSRGRWRGAGPLRSAPRRWKRATLSAALLIGLLTWQPHPAERPVPGPEFTLIAYNIRMGYGLGGRLDLDRIAAWARARHPDVVLLSEVDRGWLLNGGHDDLARIARGLGMGYHFAWAADRLWGDAVLTDLPVARVESVRLGRHGYPTGAQAQSIVLDVGGRRVGIVNTHLQSPPGQAPEVAAIVRRLRADALPSRAGAGDPIPVILAGDLNTTPEEPAMRVLEAAGLTDPLRALGDPPTSPADRPVRRIDHVLISPGLTAVSADAPRVPYSDHLPVVVRLRLT
ncbi:endonuclease/exonuclease/phosphatase family protein [Microbispora sp. ATCC PTA-5024]|uniref:endonuclease/exonuclease/phosphatase family protein n=1 Tax=Microbispora sp. ATCC PTA-5024 TaxID=316330 RepID=UPI0003DC6A36|nr:endonuclease/exonuclease/phosphatase family protein [Microbispora sp. ATCC PTA-5024]ETK35835.1 hypothetical protein MPTA5024_12210 [Microbispora sp. ATCC PTA-5024]